MPIGHKGVMIILDGLGDRSSQALGGRTPLEEAATPALDRLAGRGLCGLIDPLLPGLPVATHTGTGALMGLPTRDAVELSRGPVEAAGVGLTVQPGDVALRCNFATLRADGDDLVILDRRAGRIREGTEELASVLGDVPLGQGISAALRPATHHRAVLRLSGPGLSASVSDTDPGAGPLPRRVQTSYPLNPDDAAGAKASEALNRFVREAFKRLSGHPVNRRREADGLMPANGIITRGAGVGGAVRSLVNYLGLSAAVVAGERTVLGLARLFNYTLITDTRFTSLCDTDLNAKVQAVLAALDAHDLVFLHVKGPDICAHDMDPVAKRDFLQRVDQALAPLLHEEGLVIAVSGDHSTDSNLGRHCGDPVPTILASPNGRRDACQHFGESHCMGGGLGRISANSLLVSMLDAMGAMHNFRRSDGPYLDMGGWESLDRRP